MQAVVPLLAFGVLVVITALAACGEDGEVFPGETATPTPLVRPSDYPWGPDDTPPPVNLAPEYPEFSPTAPPERPTPTTPTSINVRGVEVPLAEGMTYRPTVSCTDCEDPRTYQMVEYGEGTGTYSWVMFSKDGVKVSSVHPEHADLFRPLLDALVTSE